MINILRNSLLEKDIDMFKKQCLKSPKLRTYNTLFSPFTDHSVTIQYTRMFLPFVARKKIAQLRLGILPIKIESDRYVKEKIPAHLRFCTQPNCTNANINQQSDKKIENKHIFWFIALSIKL